MGACGCSGEVGSCAIKDQTIAVFGGLGRQGASVATELLEAYPQVKLRLVTRGDVNSERAKAFSDNDRVTVVKADMAQYDTLLPVLRDCYGCFIVTAFWPTEADGGSGATKPLDPSYEKESALNTWKACQKCGVKHVVYSALEKSSWYTTFNTDNSLKKMANGLVVPHVDGKGEVMEIMNAQDEIKVDFIWVGFYYENWFGMKPSKGEDGKYGLYLPLKDDTPQFMVSVGDVGKFVAPLFARLPEKNDKIPCTGATSWPITGAISAKYTGAELAKVFKDVCLPSAEVNFVSIPHDVWAQTGIKFGMQEEVAWDFAHMFVLFNDEHYVTSREKAYQAKPSTVLDFPTFLGNVKGMLYPERA